MAECKNCARPAKPGENLCGGCLNNWLVMRVIISNRLREKIGEPTRETQPLIDQEFKRLDTQWKRDRAVFSKEVNQWYEQ